MCVNHTTNTEERQCNKIVPKSGTDINYVNHFGVLDDGYVDYDQLSWAELGVEKKKRKKKSKMKHQNGFEDTYLAVIDNHFEQCQESIITRSKVNDFHWSINRHKGSSSWTRWHCVNLIIHICQELFFLVDNQKNYFQIRVEQVKCGVDHHCPPSPPSKWHRSQCVNTLNPIDTTSVTTSSSFGWIPKLNSTPLLSLYEPDFRQKRQSSIITRWFAFRGVWRWNTIDWFGKNDFFFN